MRGHQNIGPLTGIGETPNMSVEILSKPQHELEFQLLEVEL